MTTQAELATQFLRLHRRGEPLLMPNAWDIGSAVLLASLGFEAIATTSGGFAASRGRLDGAMSGAEVIGHTRDLAAAIDLPLSADLENCFAHDPAGVAKTVLLWRRHQLDPSAKDQDGARIGRQAPQPTEAPLVLLPCAAP